MIGIRDAQVASKTLFLGVIVRVFFGRDKHFNQKTKSEIKSLHPPVQVGIIQSTEGPNRKKGEGRVTNYFSLLEASIFSWPGTLELLVLGPLDSGTYAIATPSSRFQASDWQLPIGSPGV